MRIVNTNQPVNGTRYRSNYDRIFNPKRVKEPPKDEQTDKYESEKDRGNDAQP